MADESGATTGTGADTGTGDTGADTNTDVLGLGTGTGTPAEGGAPGTDTNNDGAGGESDANNGTGGDTGADKGTVDAGAADEAKAFLESLPEELRAHERLKDFKSVGEMAKALSEMKTAAEVPEAYEYGEGSDEAMTGLVSAFAKDAGLSQEQLNKVLGFHNHLQGENQKALEASETKWTKEIDTEWGAAKPQNLREANECLKRTDPDGVLSKFITDAGVTKHPVIVKYFYELSRKLGEDGFLTSGGGGGGDKSAADVLYGGS